MALNKPMGEVTKAVLESLDKEYLALLKRALAEKIEKESKRTFFAKVRFAPKPPGWEPPLW